MTKAELIDRIARSRDLPPEITKKCIGEILDIAFGELSGYFTRAKVTRKESPRFTFPGFGTFTKKKRSARRGVNPRTLEPMEIEACNTLDFKPGSELRRTMNPGSAVKASSKSKSRKTSSKATKKRAATTKKAKKSTATRSKKKATKATKTQKSTAAAPRSGKVRNKKVATPASKKRKADAAARKLEAAGPNGRPLVTREEAELEFRASADDLALPDAPLRRVSRRRKSGLGSTG